MVKIWNLRLQVSCNCLTVIFNDKQFFFSYTCSQTNPPEAFVYIYIYIFFKEFLNHISPPPPPKKNCLFFPYLTSNIIYFLFITFSFFFYWFEQLLQGVMSHLKTIYGWDFPNHFDMIHGIWDYGASCITFRIYFFF